MKVNRLETHDRLLEVQKQAKDASECCADFIEKKPFGDLPFYIFGHCRTEDNGIDKRYIYQPRLNKPEAQTNSMLFKAYPNTDVVKVIWIIPDERMWDTFLKSDLFGSNFIKECIQQYKKNPRKLSEPEESDLSPDKAQQVYFDLYPQMFKRDTLPENLKRIYDRKMDERKKSTLTLSEES